MPAQLILAPTGRGKTEYALSRISAVRAEEAISPIWVILPNQIQVHAFAQRLGARGGALGVELGTFYHFYAELLARRGQPTAHLSDAVLHRLIRRLVDQLVEAGRLVHYAPLRHRAGFASLLRGLFQELKQARVQSQALEIAAAGSPPHLPAPVVQAQVAELAILYSAYQDWLIRSNWMDDEGQGWLAALALERDGSVAADLRLLVVDGFDEFNPTQLAVLALLAGRAAETIITLTGDPACGDRLAHRRFCRAQQALREALDVEADAYSVPGPSTNASKANALSHLEAALFQLDAEPVPAGDVITCVEAQNRSAEVRAALRWLKGLLLRESYRLDEVALLVRDMEPYRPYLDEVAAEFGLPIHVAGGQPLATNPAVAALLNLLGLPLTNWPRRSLLDALACPYFDWSFAGIGAEQVRALAAAARAGLVIAGLDQWREALARLRSAALRAAAHPDLQNAALDDDEDMAPPHAPDGEPTQDLQSALEAVVARLTPPTAGTLSDYVAFVENVIGQDPRLAARLDTQSRLDAEEDDSLRVVARAREQAITAERDVAALRCLKDILRGLVLTETILPEPGGRPAIIDYARFFAELRGAAEATIYEPLSPPAGSALLAAPLLYVRGLSFRAVALLGLSEGEFPQPEREDPLLPEVDRESLRAAGLPLQSRLQGDEASLFYEAITRPRERLLLTRPCLADDGQGWDPSPYWDEVVRLTQAPVLRLRPQDPQPLDTVASLPEALLAGAHLCLYHSCGPGGPKWSPIPEGWEQVLHAAEVVRRREKAGSPGNPWDGDLAAAAPILAAHFGPDHVWSASRLEAYATCPFLFLTSSVLDLEPRLPPREGYDVRILGSMYHAILEQTYRAALSDATQDRLPDALRALLPQVADRVFDAAPETYGFRPTALWSRQREELGRILARTLEALIEATAAWQPVALEQAFGLQNQPALDVEQEGRRLRLRGFVDRLDRDTDGRLQVIDYKAGSTLISAHDLEIGKRVQLPLYALAVRQTLNLGEVGGGFYWHIGPAEPSRLRLEGYLGGVEGAIQTALEHAFHTVEAVRAGQFAPHPPAGGCPTNCPAAAFCWHYTPRAW